MEINEAIETIKSNMESEQVRDFLQPIKDQHFSKSLETWKQNNLSELIKQSTTEPESPAEIELKKLQSELEKMKADSERKEFESQVLAYGMSRGLPETVCKNLAIENMETAKGLIDNLSGQIKSVIETERIKIASGATPKAGGITPSNFNLETISDMTTKEIYSNLNTLTKDN